MRTSRTRCAVPVLTLLLASGTALAATPEELRALDLRAGLRLMVSWDDNALLGRRGQFLGTRSRDGGQRDFAVFQDLEIELGSRLGRPGDRVSFAGRVVAPMFRTITELLSLDTAIRLALDQRIGEVAIRPALGLRLHLEDPEWSHRTVEPSLTISHTFDQGLMAIWRYRFTAQRFPRTPQGETQPRNSYANVDYRGHLADLDLRQWLAHALRIGVRADLYSGWYGGNTSISLADYAGLEQGSPRSDWGGGATAEATVVPWRALLLSAGARGEWASSNSDAFTFHGLHGLASVLVAFGGRHSLYAAVDFGAFGFPRAQFDRRYANTRQDYRRELSAVYRFDLSDSVNAQLILRREDAVSNDCADFDPERDVQGLPVTSRSYSCYSRTRIQAFLHVEI